jgi:cysteine synthase
VKWLKVVTDVTELIGETPMVRINKLTEPGDATVYAKLEWFNSGGSIKDRLALYMFEYARSA